MNTTLFQEFLMPTLNKKTYCQSIRLERAEGPSEECRAVTVPDFLEANNQIRHWAKTAPSLGYNKIDFCVTWEDGETYEGRYDMVPTDQDYADLGRHIVSFLEFHDGEHCPKHWTEGQYQEYLQVGKITPQDYKDCLEQYHIPTYHTQEVIDFHAKRQREAYNKAQEKREREERAEGREPTIRGEKYWD